MIIDAHCYMLMHIVYLKTLALLLLLCELLLLAPSVLGEGMRMSCASCTSTLASAR